MNRDKTFGVVFFIFEIRIIFIESEAVDETNLVRIQDEGYRTILDGVRIRVGVFVVMKDVVADTF
jgi:hypothetical protein